CAKGDNRAREAAEAALSSPLLEELNLTGAEGILVNVTADETMGINEFQTVNEIVVEMAADDADVIVGTAIDPTLDGELRVTVVATGLGKPAIAKGPSLRAAAADDEADVVPAGLKNSSGETDYGVFEKPTAIRQQARPRRSIQDLPDMHDEYLDVPAFLRHQAD
ncbi:MAG: cell division protein FtsZ, partial [Nevskiales bacterium]